MLIAVTNGTGQTNFRWPLDKLNKVTGNYGELRPNHFHMGLDVSTNNAVNYPVFAAERGYVSRIRVSATGYGRSVYITHPNGYTTVYAHLNKFEEPIASIILAEMHKQQLNEIDFNLTDTNLTIARGQLIALSGNTGGSSGPHLHFEIRDTKSEIPLNPVLFFPSNDKIAPVLKSLQVLNLSDTSMQTIPARLQLKVLKYAGDTVFMADQVLSFPYAGFVYSAFDVLVNKGNQNQVNKAALSLDSNLIYAHEFSHLNFDDARYVNEYAFKSGKDYMQKCFLPEQYPEGIYSYHQQRGIIRFADTNWHRYSLRLTDDAGNARLIVGRIRSNQITRPAPTTCKGLYLRAGRDTVVSSGKFRLQFAKRTMYHSSCLSINAGNKALTIAPASRNILQAISVSLYDTSSMRSKKILINGNTVIPARIQQDSIVFQIKTLGAWQLKTDTLPPLIKFNSTTNKSTKHSSSLRISIQDSQSGIGNYRVFVNNVWTLAYYDAKNKILLVDLPPTLTKGKLQLTVEASDKCGNLARKTFSIVH